jgi:ABC-type glutathione transport system ATPase component
VKRPDAGSIGSGGERVPGGQVLTVRDLRVSVAGDGAAVPVVDGVSFVVGPGEALALVGESGAGKSMTAMTLLGLTRDAGARVDGTISLRGLDLTRAGEPELRRVRGERVGMVFQDPATALDPVQRIGRQIAEQMEVHGRCPADGYRSRVRELLERVRLPRAAEIARSYPFELSGGMRQRAAIAMAISCEPEMLIADEPTSALDAVVQAEILDLLDELRRDRGMAILLATHDLRAVARIADRIAIMRSGRVVEAGPARELLENPSDAYTRRLLRAPGARPPASASAGESRPVLRVERLVVEFRRRRLARRAEGTAGPLRAVDGVSLTVGQNETVAIVGQSGSGKTTLARAVLRLVEPSDGSIAFRGRTLTGLRPRALRPLRRELQAVFQDPAASLNPRQRVRSIVSAPLRRYGVGRSEAEHRAARLLERVELVPAEHLDRFPHQLSGGQRQRVGIARALALEPRLVVLDEPVSALDAPVRGQVMDLLERLQRELSLSYLLISHDLDLVRLAAHRVAVMHEGAIVESGAPDDLMERPEHPATRALVAAARR